MPDTYAAAARDSGRLMLRAAALLADADEAAAKAEREKAALRVELDRLADLPECRRQLPDGTVPTGTEAALRAWMQVAADLGVEARFLREENDRLEREVEDLRSRLTAVERLRPARPLVVADALRGTRFNGGGA